MGQIHFNDSFARQVHGVFADHNYNNFKHLTTKQRLLRISLNLR